MSRRKTPKQKDIEPQDSESKKEEIIQQNQRKQEPNAKPNFRQFLRKESSDLDKSLTKRKASEEELKDDEEDEEVPATEEVESKKSKITSDPKGDSPLPPKKQTTVPAHPPVRSRFFPKPFFGQTKEVLPVFTNKPPKAVEVSAGYALQDDGMVVIHYTKILKNIENMFLPRPEKEKPRAERFLELNKLYMFKKLVKLWSKQEERGLDISEIQKKIDEKGQSFDIAVQCKLLHQVFCRWYQYIDQILSEAKILVSNLVLEVECSEFGEDDHRFILI